MVRVAKVAVIVVALPPIVKQRAVRNASRVYAKAMWRPFGLDNQVRMHVCLANKSFHIQWHFIGQK